VFARDEAGNRSAPTVLVNDVEGPRLLFADLSPRTPRAGLPLRVALRFDEAPGAAPEVGLVAAGQAQTLSVSADPETGAWSAWTDEVALPPGPAALRVAGRRRARELAPREPQRGGGLAGRLRAGLGAPVPSRRRFGVARDGRRRAPRPSPPRVEARLVHAGADRLCGATQAASDGSFEAIAVAPALEPGDEVKLQAFDETGGVLGEATLAPDFTPPRSSARSRCRRTSPARPSRPSSPSRRASPSAPRPWCGSPAARGAPGRPVGHHGHLPLHRDRRGGARRRGGRGGRRRSRRNVAPRARRRACPWT
jgi:hypothetical protein